LWGYALSRVFVEDEPIKICCWKLTRKTGFSIQSSREEAYVHCNVRSRAHDRDYPNSTYLNFRKKYILFKFWKPQINFRKERRTKAYIVIYYRSYNNFESSCIFVLRNFLCTYGIIGPYVLMNGPFVWPAHYIALAGSLSKVVAVYLFTKIDRLRVQARFLYFDWSHILSSRPSYYFHEDIRPFKWL
jgi:hypothetical protein